MNRAKDSTNKKIADVKANKRSEHTQWWADEQARRLRRAVFDAEDKKTSGKSLEQYLPKNTQKKIIVYFVDENGGVVQQNKNDMVMALLNGSGYRGIHDSLPQFVKDYSASVRQSVEQSFRSHRLMSTSYRLSGNAFEDGANGFLHGITDFAFNTLIGMGTFILDPIGSAVSVIDSADPRNPNGAGKRFDDWITNELINGNAYTRGRAIGYVTGEVVVIVVPIAASKLGTAGSISYLPSEIQWVNYLDDIASTGLVMPGVPGPFDELSRYADKLDDLAEISNPLEGIQYTDKVKQQMRQGDYHAFPESVDAFGG